MHELYQPELWCKKTETNGSGVDRLCDPVCCCGTGAWKHCLLLWAPELLHIYSEQADVIACGMEILSYTTMTYFLCGLMDLFPGALRGMGYSTVPMILSIIGTVGMRILWIYGLFPTHRSLGFLFISYPASWIATIVMQVICFWFVRRKIHRENA